MEVINALGRRKAAIARIYVSEGSGKITINKRDLKDYFPSELVQYVVKQPLNLLDVAEKYDIKVNLRGGGFTGQSQALRLAIARALVKINEEDKKALRCRAQEARSAQGTSQIPVQQALIFLLTLLIGTHRLASKPSGFRPTVELPGGWFSESKLKGT